MKVHQEIKEGDYVYYPKASNKLFKVVRNPAGNLAILLDNNHYLTVDIYGRSDIYDKTPSVYLTTSEIKTKLEEHFKVEFESLSTDEKLVQLEEKKEEDEDILFEFKFTIVREKSDKPSLFNRLINWFKNRGKSK